MPRKQKIDLAKVRAALNTARTKCGHVITPDKILRRDSETLECPKCGERFKPTSKHP